MRTLLVAAIPTLLTLIAPAAFAGQVWLDANGDGLPDQPYSFFLFPSNLVTVDVWIDSQSFTFTAYRVTVDRSGWNTLVSASYAITGGTNLPIDTSSRPNSLIYAGAGYSGHGTHKVGTFVAHVDSICGCPSFYQQIDVVLPSDPYACRLTANGGSTVSEFSTGSGIYVSCYPDFPTLPCCLPNGTCEPMQEFFCWELGGQPLGLCQTCADCPSTGTQTESWGRVKSIQW